MIECGKPPVLKKMSWDSQYGVCFRACMAHLVAIVTANRKKNRLDVEIESGHPNVKDTDRIFRDMKAQLKRRGIEVLGTITIAEKHQSPPLMVSDFLAYSYSLM